MIKNTDLSLMLSGKLKGCMLLLYHERKKHSWNPYKPLLWSLEVIEMRSPNDLRMRMLALCSVGSQKVAWCFWSSPGIIVLFREGRTFRLAVNKHWANLLLSPRRSSLLIFWPRESQKAAWDSINTSTVILRFSKAQAAEYRKNNMLVLLASLCRPFA